MDTSSSPRFYVFVCLLCAAWGDLYAAIPCDTDADCPMKGATCELSQEECVCAPGFLFNGAVTACLPIIESPYSSPCTEDVQCSAKMIAGAVCVKNQCVCAEGFHYLHGRCWNTKGLGESCTIDAQCRVNPNHEAASCVDFKCTCSSPEFYQRGNTDCRRVGTNVGDECGLDLDCQSDYLDLECSGEFKCDVTKAHTTAAFGRSDEASGQEGCSEVSGCSATTRAGDNENQQDQRPSQRIESERQPRWPLVMATKMAAPCVTREDCGSGSNAECVGDKCVCVPGYYPGGVDKTCVRELGEECSTTEDCSHIPNSNCRTLSGTKGRVCSCPAHMTPLGNNRQCLAMKEFGKTCVLARPEACTNYGAACTCRVDPGTTIKNYCLCLPGFHFQENELLCWKSRGLNEICSGDQDCHAEHGPAVCNNSTSRVCECSVGYQPSQENSDCVQTPEKMGDFCVDADDCKGLDTRTECVQGACSCMRGYFDHPEPSPGDSCRTGIGGNCRSSEGCHVEFSVCSHETDVCECVEGYISSTDGTTCHPVAHMEGDVCTQSAQCHAQLGMGSNCTEIGVCLCLQGHHYSNKACWPTRRLSERCSRSSECYREEDWGPVECRNGVCHCPFDSQLNSNATKCGNRINSASQHSTSTLTGAVLLLLAMYQLK